MCSLVELINSSSDSALAHIYILIILVYKLCIMYCNSYLSKGGSRPRHTRTPPSTEQNCAAANYLLERLVLFQYTLNSKLAEEYLNLFSFNFLFVLS